MAEAVVTGYFAYHAVPTNVRALGRSGTTSPTSGDARCGGAARRTRMTWARMTQLAAGWLPPPRILHPWPDQRFAVKHPR